MKPSVLAIPLFALAMLSGCYHGPSAPEATASGQQDQTAQPVVVVVGIDTTGSYPLLKQVVAPVADFFLRNARPGETWYFRLICNNSYSDRASIPVWKGRGSVTLPHVEPAPTNPFNKQARLQHLVSLKRFEQVRNEVATKIRSLQLRPVRGTDIWGFLAKAQDLQATDIVMFTDLGDTLGWRINKLDLKGTRVWVIVAHSGRDPRVTLKWCRQWEQWLRKAGASQVKFSDVSQDIELR